MNIRQLTISASQELAYPEGLVGKASPRLLTQYIQYIQEVTTPTSGHTKTRGEVKGGGAKPWRQKGTGRARQGSIRAPHWRGGGITFGPRTEQIGTPRMNKKMRREAFLTLLTQAAKEGRLVVANFNAEDDMKKIRQTVTEATADSKRRFLVIADAATTPLKAARNLPDTQSINLDHLGARQMYGRSAIVVEQPVWEALITRYSK